MKFLKCNHQMNIEFRKQNSVTLLVIFLIKLNNGTATVHKLLFVSIFHIVLI